ncbi:MAG: hypothetical protein B6I38_08500 [Anaerolineaceae bacterium 4572_5.1]|nr:MAG: hypothetical protein B6I38_08500 [Anaerolineaceae bacterium 4572_5.1]
MTKILLAEDDETMVSLLKTLLGLEGFDVASMDIAEKDLLSLVRHENPKVLLLDVHLPRENGMDILRALREDDELKNTRVVMTSGMNLKDECLASGADAFLLKPYMPDDLIKILRQYS